MDKNAIKKYAVWARRELISRVSQKATFYGITEKDTGDINATSVNGYVLSETEKEQRQALISKINEKGYKQVMEEVAYTWFNRFSALRFMEVNGYLPSRIRVFTDDENAFKPQILTEAINLDIDGIDMEKVYALKNDNKNDELFKYLVIVQCNALNPILPYMFQRIADYTELLFPDNLLREGSVVEQMVTTIPEEDWKDAVQIIGWLYQYYNTEKKDEVFTALKKNVKITKENIPPATQLFTPDWIVRYMVENSLGRLWLEGHPNDDLKAEWKYYLDEAEQEPQVQAQLDTIRKEYADITPEQIKCIDPCSGSGHILVYMFDVLLQIYEAYGYTTREAVESIVKNNIYGLDIDDRATQLGYFAVMMKARKYDRRFFSRGIQPNVYAIQESNGLDSDVVEYFCNGDDKLKKAMKTLIDEMHNAKEYGSILSVSQVDFSALYNRIEEIREDISIYKEVALNQLLPFIKCAKVMAQKYHTVITNPPYMGASGMSKTLSDYVKKYYPNSKSDLFAVFIERCGEMTGKNGYQAMITQHAWMFLSSFEKLRKKLQMVDTINMAHLGARAFEEIGGEVVQTTAFVVSNRHIANYKGTYCRLIEPTTQQGKEDMFLCGENRYFAKQDNFSKIPGSPVAYWVSEAFIDTFSNPRLGEISKARRGLETGNNNKYIHYWYEVSEDDIDFHCSNLQEFERKWLPHNKGGEFRTWFGNDDLVVWFKNDGEDIRKSGNLNGYDVYLREGITWTALTSSKNSFRYSYFGHTFDSNKGPLIVDNGQNILYYLLSFLNSPVAQNMMKILNPTLSLQNGDMDKIPIIFNTEKRRLIDELSRQNVEVSKIDWNNFETSWDFTEHPLVKVNATTIANAYSEWESECEKRFSQLKANEEELNRIFIDIYGLQDELTPEVEDKDVTVRKADLQRDIKSLISYAVGCMFGRYSLDVNGLAFAGGEWDDNKYYSFIPEKNAIIPICDDEYFEQDIVGRFVEFIRVVYGESSLEDNLKFIANALGGKGQPREVIRSYFINDFYKDHCKIYQKRPIYWLFDSGKKNGFKALIYMHRYQPDTIARIRTDYVHEQQSRYRTAIADLQNRITNAGTSERVKLNKKLKAMQEQAEEIRKYEEKIHHLADQMIAIDLDDGVKKNYELFADVLAKIK